MTIDFDSCDGFSRYPLHLISVTFIVVMLYMVAADSALAQSSETWLPVFNSNEQVYIDPKLKNHKSYPVNLGGLKERINKASEKHKFKVFVVATQQGSEDSGKTMAIRKLDQLMMRWKGAKGFPQDNYLVVLWVRFRNDVTHGSVAANAGSNLRRYGFTGSYFSNPNRGPVIRNLKKYMPENPKGAISAIVSCVSGDIDSYHQMIIYRKRQAIIAAQKAKERAKQRAIEQKIQAQRDAEMRKKLPIYAGGGLGIVFFSGLFGILINRYKKYKRQAQTALEVWSDKLENANQVYIKLSESYLGFLSEQSDWQDRFKGETLEQYKAAIEDFADLSARQHRANEMLDRATKNFENSIWPFTAGLKSARRLLEDDVIVITGDDLPIETATLFGGLLEKTEYRPDQLLEAMSELFDRTNSSLHTIVQAVRGVEENSEDIKSLLSGIENSKSELDRVGLPFAPYDARYMELVDRHEQILRTKNSNPLSAYQESSAIESMMGGLKADLERAVQIKWRLGTVTSNVDKVSQDIAVQRTKTIEYSYPLITGESLLSKLPSTYKLDSAEGNPDKIVADAYNKLNETNSLLESADLDEAAQKCKEADQLAFEASGLVSDVLNAKAYVEMKIVLARNTLDRLTSELPVAKAVMETLMENFLPQNYVGRSEGMAIAHTVKEDTPNRLTRVKDLYFSQSLIAARNALAEAQSMMDNAREELTLIHKRLGNLTKMRQDSRSNVEECLEKEKVVAVRIQNNDFTTSKFTESLFARTGKQLLALEAVVKEEIADWEEAYQKSREIKKALDTVNYAIDNEQSSYKKALDSLASLERIVAEAEPHILSEKVRLGPINMYEDAKESLLELRDELRKPKSNWKYLCGTVDGVKKVVQRARGMAMQDHHLSLKAEKAIKRASDSIVYYKSKYYSHGVSANLVFARRTLKEAREEYVDKHYNLAQDLARKAHSESEEANRKAIKEMKQREADDWSYSSGVFGGGGGFSGGGGFGGGGFGGGSGGGGYGGGSGGGGY